MSDAGPGAFAMMGRVRGQVAVRARATYAAIFESNAFDTTILRRSTSRARIAPAQRDSAEIAALIASLPRLAALTAADARTLATRCDAVTAAKGALVADAGDNPDHLHIVLRGALRGALKRRRGSEAIHVHGPGEIAGLVPIIDGFPHPLRIEACEEALLLRMTRREFETLSKGKTDLAIGFFDLVSRQLARDVRRANRHLGRAQGLARFNAEGRN
jgi:CRP/FNR family transcriptional regulator, cyclic AMP receptor protein